MPRILGKKGVGLDAINFTGDFIEFLTSTTFFRRLTKNQKKKVLRRSLADLENSSKRHKICGIGNDAIPGQDMGDRLWEEVKQGKGDADYLYLKMVGKKYPPRAVPFPSYQPWWERLENSKYKKRGGRNLE